MESLLNELWNSIDLMYVLLCNATTYVILSCFPKNVDLATGWKRLIGAIVAILLGILCVKQLGHDPKQIFYGFFIQFLLYDYILKWLFQKMDLVGHKITRPDEPHKPDE